MKTKLICSTLLALAASFNAVAQNAAADLNSPALNCVASLATDGRLKPIADKVVLGQSSRSSSLRAPNRVATDQERAAVAVWLEKRQECFQAGAKSRQAVATPQEIAFLRSVFVFQQRLVADLQGGRVTYTEFNQRRLELVEAAGQEI